MTLVYPGNQTIFVADTHEQITQSLANYLPGGELFRAKNLNNSNMRTFLGAMAQSILRLELKVQKVADEIYIQTTNDFIEEWEVVVGIPDECFKNPKDQSIEIRRKWVIVKLALMNTLTEDDWIFLAKYLGYDIKIDHAFANSIFPLTLPFILEESDLALAYTIIITIKNLHYVGDVFPLTLPFTLGESAAALLECLFNKLVPVDCRLVFNEELAP